jgi:hypothetical protein
MARFAEADFTGPFICPCRHAPRPSRCWSGKWLPCWDHSRSSTSLPSPLATPLPSPRLSGWRLAMLPLNGPNRGAKSLRRRARDHCTKPTVGVG